MKALRPDSLLGGYDLALSGGMRDAGLLLTRSGDRGKSIGPYDGEIKAARRLRLDQISCEIRITEEDYMTVLGVIANEALQLVIRCVMDVAH